MLTIRELESHNPGLRTMMVDGLTKTELKSLKAMKNDDGLEKLLDILDQRKDGLGTTWKCGYGVYGFWCDNEGAYINIGKSCD